MVKTGTAFVLTAIALVGGFALGRISSGGKLGGAGGDEAVVASAEDKEIVGSVERIKVPADGPSKGAEDALVTIVEFSDFQCPFCSRVGPTIEQIMKEYKGKVRVVFKHNPLPFHGDAQLAAEASLAAHEQGKFWEMHDKLFGNQQAIKRDNLDTYAKDIGLDVGKFKQALDSGKFKKAVEDDLAAGRAIGVQGTPNFFVNGRKIEGAVPFESFKTVIDDEVARAEKLVAKGTPKKQVYAKLMASVSAAPAAPAAAPAAPAVKPPVSDEVFKVEIDGSPVEGAKEPKVTIVSFSDFQCPFCSRVLATLKQIEDNYKNDVAFSFKHLPLDFHQNATPAAQAAEAARLQGKFWEMHDKLFANQQALSVDDFDKYAKELGLNMVKFKKDYDSKEVKDRIERDKAAAAKFGARGTPSFFINGRVFRGAQPYDAFKTVIDEEIKKADAKIASGVSRKNLYAEIIKNGKSEASAEAPAAAPGAPPAGARLQVPVGNAPTKGPADALVTIVIFSDYQCPFCSRVEPTLKQVEDEYKGKVRFAWKDLPLPFHQNAKPAALAAHAAGEQGKFWQMHDKLFANQQALSPEDFDKYAQELGLNVSKFKAAQQSEKVKQIVEEGAALAAKIGANGTPAFFINGILLSGAQPYTAFKSRIDEELKKAEELVKKGTPKSKVYEAIMKEAASAPAPAPAAANNEAAGPENDQTVTKIDPGNSPSRGPKNAPITMVVFSEFQCPFCSRVNPTIHAIEEQYKGKVRVVFKNFPLDFHQNAKPAAQAALAANEQGKFWEMHDKLFANQQTLDRASLDKFAQEIGLNMDKFKQAMDANKYTALIEEDMKLGQSVGVNGTPATFINGRKIGGAYPLETFKKIVDQELAKKKG
ncbi:MAG: thioredoxin domain-containing protein [Deltaproteobacteria bacterium]|nr:thioredoxin domain-containing protein [Deltaproteobacteria bacterium]